MGTARLKQEVCSPPSHPHCALTVLLGLQSQTQMMCVSSWMYPQLEVRSPASHLRTENSPGPQRSRCLSLSWTSAKLGLPAAPRPRPCAGASGMSGEVRGSPRSLLLSFKHLPSSWLLGDTQQPLSPPSNTLKGFKGRGWLLSAFPSPHPTGPAPSARAGVSLSLHSWG